MQPQKKRKNNAKRGFLIFLKVICWIFVIVLSPIILLYFIIRGIVKLSKKRKWEKEGKHGKMLLLSSDISDIDLMEGYVFEEYLKTLLFYDGYEVQLTNKSRDYGADLIISKDGTRIAVQAKRYNKPVGVKCVQEVLAALSHYKCDEAMVITSSKFTEPCEQLAKENGVRLMDRDELIDLYKKVNQKLKINIKESVLVNKQNADFEQNFPYMI